MKTQGMTALVTGGASGLGRAVVQHLIAHGAQVALADANVEAGARVAEESGAMFVAMDVANEAEVDSALRQVSEQLGVPRIVVQAAGISPPPQATVGRLGAYPADLFRRVLEVNLVGSFLVATRAAELMRELDPLARGERGIIINVSSITAEDGPGGTLAYTASKAGVQGMTLVMARDLSRYGIRVVNIAPGTFQTALVENAVPELIESLRAEVPFPNDTLGDPQDFAKLALSVIENVMINGSTIRLDGAARMARY
ncbi:MAG: NAD(P)-dependent dehydrogenase (short-subunit alcohol dehydrogenase family) [Bermanella sp.]|jgi:NAD(P)-dependent dehydrogenase (short-subunit alcohol dehydrogenase family)